MVLKGVDDVKDTVRQAATSTLRMIGKMTVRMSNIEVSPRAVVKRAVDIALPFLLDKGINNEVKDTQMVCMYYAIEIIKVRTPCVPCCRCPHFSPPTAVVVTAHVLCRTRANASGHTSPSQCKRS